MINWRLVVNLVFLLLLLLAARERWFVRASDEALRRRAGRRDLILGIVLMLAMNVAIPIAAVRLGHPVLLFWLGIAALGGCGNLYERHCRRREAQHLP